MKFFFFACIVAFVSADTTVSNDERKPVVLHTKQRRWLADNLRAYHQRMRTIHKDYIPLYPDAPLLVTISIGTPSVDFSVSLETGSEATFVLAKDYPGRDAYQPFYDPDQSSSSQSAGGFQAVNGFLELYGWAYTDVFGFFGLGVSTNTTQRFGVVNGVSDYYEFSPELPDGVLGLSWNPADAAAPNENSSAVLNLFEVIGGPRFYCQWLDDVTDPIYGRQVSGITTFGGCIDDRCGAATAENTLPLVWLDAGRSLVFQVDSFTYQRQQFNGGYGKVDSGVPLIFLPHDSMLAVYNDVQPDYDYYNELYTVDCSQAGSLPDWTFTIGGKNYSIPSTAYVVDLLLPDEQCAFSAYYSDADTADFALGYVFHQLWCIKMDVDNQAISFLDVIPAPTEEPSFK